MRGCVLVVTVTRDHHWHLRARAKDCKILHHTGQCHIISYPAQSATVTLPFWETLAEFPPHEKTVSREFILLPSPKSLKTFTENVVFTWTMKDRGIKGPYFQWHNVLETHYHRNYHFSLVSFKKWFTNLFSKSAEEHFKVQIPMPTSGESESEVLQRSLGIRLCPPGSSDHRIRKTALKQHSQRCLPG